jgi:hypothetical protein
VSLAVAAAIVTELLSGCSDAISTSTPVINATPHRQPILTPATPVESIDSLRLCRHDQLAIDYRAGGFATQSVFGSIVLRDRSKYACRISGRITGLGRSRTGAALRLATLTWTAPSTALSANARQWPEGHEPPHSERVLILSLEGWAVDQKSGGDAPCRPVRPASWVVQLTNIAGLVTANVDPRISAQHGVAPSMFGCRGQITAEGIPRDTG